MTKELGTLTSGVNLVQSSDFCSQKRIANAVAHTCALQQLQDLNIKFCAFPATCHFHLCTVHLISPIQQGIINSDRFALDTTQKCERRINESRARCYHSDAKTSPPKISLSFLLNRTLFIFLISERSSPKHIVRHVSLHRCHHHERFSFLLDSDCVPIQFDPHEIRNFSKHTLVLFSIRAKVGKRTSDNSFPTALKTELELPKNLLENHGSLLLREQAMETYKSLA